MKHATETVILLLLQSEENLTAHEIADTVYSARCNTSPRASAGMWPGREQFFASVPTLLKEFEKQGKFQKSTTRTCTITGEDSETWRHVG